ncbi:MAG: asparagine--tRNA ligase [Chromatiales bacterium]|jgi:asparaginyl-tRNA synthetase|nr:asparagine--tRNA ligase [Chromatiales bacterium]
MTSDNVKALLAGAIARGTIVTVTGWVRSRRDSKAGLSFVHVSDGSCFDPIQAVCANTLDNYTDEVAHLTAGCAVRISGELVDSQGKGQTVEIHATEVEVVGWVDNPDTYPVAAKRHTFEYLREIAHLRPRTNTFGAIARVRNCISQAIHRYFHERDFFWVHTPIITASDCEGAGEMFRVSTLDMVNTPQADGAVDYSQDFFGRESFLTVSGQLNVECYCLALSKVYTFGPTFRAENSNTSRHLAEFWMIEPEIAFADLDDLAALSEDFLKYVLKAVLDERADDMAFFAQRVDKEAVNRLESLVDAKFERINYGDAITILQRSKKTFEFPVSWGLDLQSEHERYLTEEHVGRPVIVTNYPSDIKAFYMRLNDDEKTVAALDVLAPGVGEIIGGAQREERLDVLDGRLAALDSNTDDLWWYRDLRRYGTVPHSGFGLGLERLINYATGMTNIRDAIPFPRTPNHAPF